MEIFEALSKIFIKIMSKIRINFKEIKEKLRVKFIQIF